VTFTDDTVATASVTVPVVPTVTGVSPSGGEQGATVPVTVSGTNFQSGAALSVGAGITVTGVTVPSATQLQATLAIALGAAVGPRDVTVTNPGGGSATLTGGFGVTAPGVPPPPPPPPPGVTLVWNGKIRDRTRPDEGAPVADGKLDGTLTATATGGARTVRQLVLVASGAASGRWDTVPSNGYWVLAAADTLDAAVLHEQLRGGGLGEHGHAECLRLLGEKAAEEARNASDFDVPTAKVIRGSTQIALAEIAERTADAPLQPPAEARGANDMIADRQLTVAAGTEPGQPVVQEGPDDWQLTVR